MGCKQITKDGNRCTRNCKKGDKYCWQHQKTKKSPTKRKSPNNAGKNPEEIQRKYCSCLKSVEAKQKNVNPYAICTASIGRISNNCKEYK